MSELPEIREADAAPQIAAIYEDIKQSAALPQVNLIFRYVATKEGALEWVWNALRPLYRSQQLVDAAAALTRSVPRPGPSPLGAALGRDDRAICKAVLDSYNSGNPQNIIALTALVRAIREPQRAATSVTLASRSSEQAASSAPFPPLPKRADLDPETLARVEAMAARHPSAPGVFPSMYLHLALWPDALVAADHYLQPIIASDGWKPLVARVIADAATTAERLAPAIELSDPSPDAATLKEVTATIEAFISQTIPELITVGALLAIE